MRVFSTAVVVAVASAAALGWCERAENVRGVSAGVRVRADIVSSLPSADRDSPPRSIRRQRPADPVDLIIVPEDEGWLVSLAATLTAKLRNSRGFPTLLALSTNPSREAVELAKKLTPRRTLVLSSSRDSSFVGEIEGLNSELVLTGSDPTQFGLHIVERFWGRPKEVVVAFTNEPSSMILGSVLAAHKVVPFIPLDRARVGRGLRVALASLGITRVWVVTADENRQALWAEKIGDGGTVLDAAAVNRLVLQHIGTGNVRSVILARVPTDWPPAGATSWLAAYWSLVRRAPVVLCDSADGRHAEQRVAALLKTHALKPRSVTILADYNSIGVIRVTDPATLGEYGVDIEPCSMSVEGGAAALGVGRIPSGSLEEASVSLGRGFARERLLGQTPARVLLVANPKTIYAPLPFCETIGRATAEEFKNFGVPVDEFYGRESDDPAILEAAREADLLLYEGHIVDQKLLEDPLYMPEWEDSYYPGFDEVWPELPSTEPSGAEVRARAAHWRRPGFPGEETGAEFISFPETQRSYGGFLQETPQLERLPLLVFQSCHSLEDWLARRAFQAGAIGVVGSVANVHSASGSAFIKAFCDGLLHRGDTAGEALRDARNYFLCLAELKARRGHRETAKVYRVALGFRLWGDPEVKIPHYSLARPRLSSVSATLRSNGEVRILTPTRRLPECSTEKYTAQVFPGSQLAGFVTQIKGRVQQRLAPVYFFRLSVPEGFAANRHANLHCPGDMSPRAAFLPDPFERFVYVVYLPKRDREGESLVLTFDEPEAAPSATPSDKE